MSASNCRREIEAPSRISCSSYQFLVYKVSNSPEKKRKRQRQRYQVSNSHQLLFFFQNKIASEKPSEKSSEEPHPAMPYHKEFKRVFKQDKKILAHNSKQSGSDKHPHNQVEHKLVELIIVKDFFSSEKIISQQDSKDVNKAIISYLNSKNSKKNRIKVH